MIFIAIPSYRDPELLSTIRSIVDNAFNPDKLSFGICQQDYDSNYISFDNTNVRFSYFSPWESMGVGWALNECYKHYNGEQFFMQLDSHMQMPKYWDLQLMEEYLDTMTTTDKPIIFSGYPAKYEYVNDEIVREPVNITYRTKIKFIKNTRILEGEAIPIYNRNEIVKARYMNGGFMFGHGSFADKVKCDPDIYFWGSEISTTIRAYTHGFDMYHPTKFTCWHHYGNRKYKETHDPHPWNEKDEKIRQIKWHELDRLSKIRLNNMLLGQLPEDDEYGLGKVRSLHDYEKYAGVNFKTKRLTPEAKSGIYNDFRYMNKVA